MAAFVDRPAIMFVVLLALFVAAVGFGALVLRRIARLSDEERDDFNIVQTAIMTLLALIVGFSLSMAVNRYDQRKSLEEGEANAIGTEYARADLADAQLGTAMKSALERYVKLRLAEYDTRDPHELARIGRDTTNLQTELWGLASRLANDKPPPISAIIATGMNDVLNSQDYSEAARINRIPIGAWILMMVIATLACMVQ